ncbi:hypothetical protein [Nocardioides panaciterrulae]|uniref:HEAT repeat protein n=1 Tax=Nocardioides panaciterrulae TaxID=661492 RepID=A0A7Y9E6I7_9ACTN|nr:hypothetical protein [Nocardioides panaciterrulae]NYD41922.1 HEAT repeat protein [Nocardioides panaciterrulae]
MARSPDILEDPTPLDGAHVDVRVRIAWLLRSWRTLGMDGKAVSVTEMAGLLKEHGTPASPPSVSGWETGRVAPSPAVVEAYEAVLELEPGSLRSVVDLVRRRFGDDGPRSPAPPVDLADLDDAVDRVVATPAPPGLAWLHFSEAVLEVRPGLPRAFLRPLVARLLSEMSRSAATAYTTRYEALALLRCSAYADLVADAIGDFFDEPGNLLLGDAARLLSERPDGRAVLILAPQLTSAEFLRLRAGVVGLEHVATTGEESVSVWGPVVGPFVRAWERDGNDPERRQQLVELWRALPEGARDPIAERLSSPVPDVPEPAASEPGGLEDQLAFCGHTAGRAAEALGLPDQPLLARLLFEALFEERDARRVTSSLLLMASPFRGHLAVELAAAARDHDDARVRRATATLILLIGREETHETVRGLLDSEDVVVVTGALFVLMHSGGQLGSDRLESLIRLPEPLDRRALFYAGMTAHPMLDRIAADHGQPLRQLARWWQRHGSAVTT